MFLDSILLMTKGITQYTESLMKKEVNRLDLEELRRDRGWTIQEVASELGISRQKYSRIEKAPYKLRDFLLADKIASLFSVPVEFPFECFARRTSPLTLPERFAERGYVDRNTKGKETEERPDSEATGRESGNK